MQAASRGCIPSLMRQRMSRLRTVSRVLELKSFRKEELDLEARKARGLVSIEQAKLDAMEKTFEETAEELYERQKKTRMDVNEIGLFYEYCSYLTGQIELQKKVLEARQEELEAKQKALLEAYREEKVFETFRQRLLQEESREQERTEQKETDSLFLSKRINR